MSTSIKRKVAIMQVATAMSKPMICTDDRMANCQIDPIQLGFHFSAAVSRLLLP
jgi:hypothetical protein